MSQAMCQHVACARVTCAAYLLRLLYTLEVQGSTKLAVKFLGYWGSGQGKAKKPPLLDFSKAGVLLFKRLL
jgi:hypothetical protein